MCPHPFPPSPSPPQMSQQGLTKEQNELVDALFTLACNRMLRKHNSLRSQGKVMDVQTFDTFMKLFKRCDSWQWMLQLSCTATFCCFMLS